MATSRIESLGLFHVGGRDDDAHARAARAHAVDQFPELPARQRIDAGRRFVENQEIGIVDRASSTSPSFCRMPPDSFFAGRSANGASPVLCKSSEILHSRSARDCPNRRAKNSMFSRDAEVGIEVLAQPLRHIGDPGTHGRTRCAASAMSPPRTKARPDCSCRAPAMMLSSVDLPTPSGPIRPTMQPAGSETVTSSSASARL